MVMVWVMDCLLAVQGKFVVYFYYYCWFASLLRLQLFVVSQAGLEEMGVVIKYI